MSCSFRRISSSRAKGGDDKLRTAYERRQEMAEYLSDYRKTTVNHLAEYFCVTDRTIRRDLEVLSESIPLYTQKGGNGGVFVDEHWYLGRRYFTEDQSNLLKRLMPGLQPEDQETLRKMLVTFEKPKYKGVQK